MKNKLEDLSIDKLNEIRKDKKRMIFESEELIRDIDSEFSRRKPFISFVDVAKRNYSRQGDKTKCAFWDCPKEPKYVTVITIGNDTFSINTCDEHTSKCYDPRHNVPSTMDIVKIRGE